MSAFDELKIQCTHCGKGIVIQSKAMDMPRQDQYHFQDAPVEVLADCVGTHECKHCGFSSELVMRSVAYSFGRRFEFEVDEVIEPIEEDDNDDSDDN
jgi:ribosomal protein L37E